MILIISDVHGFYNVINNQIEHAEATTNKKVSKVVVLGDFGLFEEKLHRFFQHKKRSIMRPVYFIDGNHEEFDKFPNLLKLYSNHFTHFPRGSVQQLGNHKCLCLGGSSFIDVINTPEAAEIKDHEIELCLKHKSDEIEIILTHDSPQGIGVPHSIGWDVHGPTGFSGSKKLLNHFSPKFWLFGHHHRWFHKTIGGTKFIGLPISWEGYVLLEPGLKFQSIKNKVAPEQPFFRRNFWGLLGG